MMRTALLLVVALMIVGRSALALTPATPPLQEGGFELAERLMNGSVGGGEGLKINEAKPIDITIAGIYFLVSVVGIAANLIVFFVIIAGREISKTVTAMYVLQLTITDSLFLSMLPLFAFYRLSNEWTFGLNMCRFARTLQNFNYNASVFFLMAMSVDRYIAVAYNTRAQQLRTRTRTAIVCIGIWVVAILMSVPQIMYADLVTRESNYTLCTTRYPDEISFDAFIDIEFTIDIEEIFNPEAENSSYEDLQNLIDYMSELEEEPAGQLGYFNISGATNGTNITSSMSSELEELAQEEREKGLNWMHDASGNMACTEPWMGNIERTWKIVQFVIAFIIPLAVITVSYLFIVRKLRVSENRMSANSVGQRTARVRKRVTRMVAVLVVCFVVCWFPYHIMQIVSLYGTAVSFGVCDQIKKMTVVLAYANSAINPLLYTFLGHNFSERFHESIRNTRRYFLPSFLRRKIKMSSSMDCKRPSVSGRYRKSGGTVKTTDEENHPRQGLGCDEIPMRELTGNKQHQDNHRPQHTSNNSNESSNSANNKNHHHKKRSESMLLPCETEMTPLDHLDDEEEEEAIGLRQPRSEDREELSVL